MCPAGSSWDPSGHSLSPASRLALRVLVLQAEFRLHHLPWDPWPQSAGAVLSEPHPAWPLPLPCTDPWCGFHAEPWCRPVLLLLERRVRCQPRDKSPLGRLTRGCRACGHVWISFIGAVPGQSPEGHWGGGQSQSLPPGLPAADVGGPVQGRAPTPLQVQGVLAEQEVVWAALAFRWQQVSDPFCSRL